jgi:osmotically-inducible protein OsmY
MTTRQRWTTGFAGVAAALVIATMIGRHATDVQQKNRINADMNADQAITKALREANVPVNGLIVRSVSGVVVVRGSGDKAAVDQVLSKLNVPRVANLVTGYAGDDEAIRRQAERQLTSTRALDGSMLHVSCVNGVVRVTGTVQSDLQADVARSVLRGINGVQAVKVELAVPVASSAPGR